MDIESLKQRKGPRNLASIHPQVLQLLNQGLLPTVNLMEWLAVDQVALLQATLGHEAELCAQLQAVALATRPTAQARIVAIGQAMGQLASPSLLQQLAQHPADVLRAWACWALLGQAGQHTHQVFAAVQPFAADEHFAVREEAWMAARPQLLVDWPGCLPHLLAMAGSSSAYVRRFASEVSRPRGVWCAHLPLLKEEPEQAQALLQLLMQDPDPYVQASVANWLNDAGKTRPDWLQAFTAQADASHPATAKILKRGLRGLA